MMAVVLGSQLLMAAQLTAQTTDSLSVSFTKDAQTVVRFRKEPKVVQFQVEFDRLDKDSSYTVEVIENDKATTLSGTYFALEIPFKTIAGTTTKQTKNFFLTIEPDSLPDRDRMIVLDLKVAYAKSGAEVPNKGAHRQLKVTVKQAVDELEDYNYLAYIGTNFDLVDGVQARNLFFATNIFVPRSTDSKKGVFISLYGNRAFSSIDSSSNVPWRTGVRPTSDSTYEAYFADADRVTTFTADNLGAYFSPFFGMGRLSDKNNGVQYYFTPAAEFVWRRISRTSTYSNAVPTDTLPFTGSLSTGFTTPSEFTAKENRFEFKIGPGVFMSHDTPKISLHVYFNAGYSALFVPQGIPTGLAGELDYRTKHDAFISARAWITEPKTGITVQAEVTNTWIEKRPFFVATLSKAFSFKNLGNILQPITAR